MKTSEASHSDPPLPEEGRLVSEAQSGDADSFARLYDAYFERVFRYVYFRVSDDQTAEDLTSQVFLKAWENLPRYKPSGHFLAWLYTIARNQVIDHYRTRKETVPLDEVGTLSAEGAAVDEQVQLRSDVTQP